MSPGAIAPGVIGAISLVLGFTRSRSCRSTTPGLALLVLGISFMIAEAFMPTFGILGFGGIAAFVIGAAMLINTNVPAFRVSYSVIAATAAISAAFLTLLMGYVWRSQRRKAVSGPEELIGGGAVVLSWENGEGYVWAQGERWHARGGMEYAAGQRLTVQELDGLTLSSVASETHALRKAKGFVVTPMFQPGHSAPLATVAQRHSCKGACEKIECGLVACIS